MIGSIESIGKGGVGIVLSDKGVVLLEDVIDGELVEYEITGKRKSVLRGSVKKIIDKSPFRKTPACPFYKSCGGCNFQHIEYKHQLDIKKNILINNLWKIGKYKPDFEIKIIPSPEYRYRTKTVFKISEGKIGFFKRGTNDHIEISDCLLVPKIVIDLIEDIKSKTKHIKKGELIVLTNGRDISAVLNHNGKKEYITEKENIIFELSDFKFFFTPLNFIQSNIFMLKKMISLFENNISDKNYTTGSDLFSGAGFFSVVLSKYVKAGFSYENSRYNIKSQKKNLKLNSVKNIKIIKTDLYKNKLEKSDFFIMDPPRGGLTKRLIKNITKNSPEKIIYFSCDSATFSRDLYYFSEIGYKPVKLKIIDNFPQTDHFEIFSVFEKKE